MVSYLLVSQLGQPLGSGYEQLPLVHAAKLSIHIKVLLVQHLQRRVEQPTQRGVVSLLHHLCARALGVMLGDERAELVEVHDELGALLVGAAEDEAQLVDGYADGLEQGGDDELVEDGAALDELDGGFQVVEEAVDVGEEDRDLAVGGE